MKIIQLRAENFKRLKAVEINPQGNAIYITGANAQGKTSVLDAIEALLKYPGKKKLPEPVRRGQQSAQISATFDNNFTVERSFSATGATQLKITAKDGRAFSSPQAVLDKFIGALSFDPTEFYQLDEREQLGFLLEALNLSDELTAIDQQREGAYNERTLINRQLKEAKARLKEWPEPDADDTKRMAEIEKLLTELQRRRRDLDKQIDSLNDELQALSGAIALADRAKDDRAIVESLEKKAAQQSAVIEKLDAKKAALIEKAKLPIAGLKFTDDGLLYNDIPLKQASDAEQIRVSLAIAMALNPELRVIRIRNGSLLDRKSKALIEALADKQDYQLWIESVDETGAVGFFIEDGEVSKFPLTNFREKKATKQ